MSADQLTIKGGNKFRSATSDLLIATRQNLLLNQVELDASREVTIRGMRDVTLNQVAIGADELARIKARGPYCGRLSFKRGCFAYCDGGNHIAFKKCELPQGFTGAFK